MQSFEIKKIGIYNSSIAQPCVNISSKRKVSEFEFELPLENGGISYIDDNSMNIAKNMLICAKPGQTRNTQFPFKCSYVHVSVFDENLHTALSVIPSFVEITNRKQYEEIFEELQRYSVMPAASDKIMLQSLILKLIYVLCTENKSNLNSKNYGVFINKALDYIKKNLASDLRLENVARHVNMSPIYFHNCFKKATEKTLHEYVEEQRIMESIHLMLGTDMTLAEVAYACGFSSQSYFNYAFKRKMHATPRNYIKSLNRRYEI